MDAGESALAEQAYRKVLEQAPDFVPAIRRLSYVVEDDDESLELARRALRLEDHGYNLAAVARALLRFEDSASQREAHEHAKRLIDILPEEAGTLEVVARVSLWNEDRELLGRAVAGMNKIDPNSYVTHYYAAIAAVVDEDRERAEAEVRRAQELGLPEEAALNLLEGAGIESRARAWRYLR
jgi:tetratricopeptide (TPR) repeat protein